MSQLEGLNILQKYKTLLKSVLLKLQPLREKDGLNFLMLKNPLLLFKFFGEDGHVSRLSLVWQKAWIPLLVHES